MANLELNYIVMQENAKFIAIFPQFSRSWIPPPPPDRNPPPLHIALHMWDPRLNYMCHSLMWAAARELILNLVC